MKVLLIAMAILLVACSRGRHNGRVKVDTIMYNVTPDTSAHKADTTTR